MYKQRIFPEKRLIIIKYYGEFRYNDIVEASLTSSKHPDFRADYNGVSDERKADIIMSPREAEKLVNLLQKELALSGRWAHLIDSPRSAVSANEYGKHCEEFHDNNIFSSVEAAGDYLDIEDLEKYLEW